MVLTDAVVSHRRLMSRAFAQTVTRSLMGSVAELHLGPKGKRSRGLTSHSLPYELCLVLLLAMVALELLSMPEGGVTVQETA